MFSYYDMSNKYTTCCIVEMCTDKIFVRVELEKSRNIPSARRSITSILAISFLSIYFL